MYYFFKKYFLIKKYKLHNIFKLINEKDIIFDIGAHSGEKSKNLIKICSKLILVEPQPECVKILKKKFSKISKVVILPCGISSKKGTLKLKINTSNPLISTFSDHWDKGRFSDSKWEKEINVNTTTLDQLINDYGHPKYIKIDVEGFELEVLKGLTKKTGIISFLVKNTHPNDVGVLLDNNGIAVRTGHHCCQPLMEFYKIPATIRVSFGIYNSLSEIDFFVDALKKAINLLR